MKNWKWSKGKIVLSVLLFILIAYCVNFYIHQPMDVTKSYIEIRSFTKSTYEMLLRNWEDKKVNPEMYQSIYQGNVPPSEHIEDYIAINYYFEIKRYSFSNIVNIEPIFNKFNSCQSAFMYAVKPEIQTNLNEGLFQTECSAFVIMYIGGLSKEEIEEAIRGAEISLLYTINHKTEKIDCSINENTPIHYVEEEEYE